MTVLGIETSTATCAVALVKDGRLLAEYRHQQAKMHAEIIPALVENLFKTTALTFSDLDGVGVSSGPGSYTGLRIGMSLAKGLAFARQIPIAGIPTVEAIAFGLISAFSPLIIAMPSRKGEIYAGAFVAENERAQFVKPVEAVLIAEFPDWAENIQTVAGPGITALETAGITGFNYLPERLWQIGALNTGLLAAEKFAVGQADDLHSLEPNYIKPFYTTAKKVG
ncbi:MAG: tRNA (adenosine(37)-N6)-threonylcarbamoyltransferase complex dimerization subunit type 1 TsaB [Calditrichaeota bacterium]|nr:MAG: tRNA (adenosine(37)-N6)-threonylcarbamoyltransferase complex dimerization subunit type 1 TsaB [Calditrichota bacterium]